MFCELYKPRGYDGACLEAFWDWVAEKAFEGLVTEAESWVAWGVHIFKGTAAEASYETGMVPWRAADSAGA